MLTRPHVELFRRAADEACAEQDELVEQLSKLGAELIRHPVIKISAPSDWRPVDNASARLAEFDWLVFSSANGVRFFMERLFATGGDIRQLHSLKLAAIGPATAEMLSQYHLHADVVPPEFRAESLAESLADTARGYRFLLIRASRGRETLAEQLSAAGAIVEQVVAYNSSDVQQPDPKVAELLAAGQIDWVTVTSSSIARSLVNLFGDVLRRSKLASISPVTSTALRKLGHEPAVEATQYTLSGLIKSIVSPLEQL